MTKTVVLVGALDTKGKEFAYVKELIEKEGLKTLVVDFGVMGAAEFPPDVGREEVAPARWRNRWQANNASNASRAEVSLDVRDRRERRLWAGHHDPLEATFLHRLRKAGIHDAGSAERSGVPEQGLRHRARFHDDQPRGPDVRSQPRAEAIGGHVPGAGHLRIFSRHSCRCPDGNRAA